MRVIRVAGPWVIGISWNDLACQKKKRKKSGAITHNRGIYRSSSTRDYTSANYGGGLREPLLHLMQLHILKSWNFNLSKLSRPADSLLSLYLSWNYKRYIYMLHCLTLVRVADELYTIFHFHLNCYSAGKDVRWGSARRGRYLLCSSNVHGGSHFQKMHRRRQLLHSQSIGLLLLVLLPYFF